MLKIVIMNGNILQRYFTQVGFSGTLYTSGVCDVTVCVVNSRVFSGEAAQVCDGQGSSVVNHTFLKLTPQSGGAEQKHRPAGKGFTDFNIYLNCSISS